MSWVVSAVGAVSAGGDDAAALFDTLDARTPLVVSTPFAAARLAEFDVGRYLRRKGLKLLSRTSQLACAAAARVEPALGGVAPERVGVVLGTAWGSLDSVVRFEREAYTEGPRFVDPILFTETVANVPAGHVSICFGWSAVNATVSAGTSSGLQAVERALELLLERRLDVVVAGGADELNEHLLRTLHADGCLAPHGPAGAEAGCLLAIESDEHARGRGAPVLGRILGATGAWTAPDDGGAVAERVRVLRGLLRRIGWDAASVDVVVRSANGEPGRERAETATLEGLFDARRPAEVSPKQVIGECWGAGGALGIVVALECLRRGRLPGAGTAAAPRRALVLDCSESGHLAAVALSAGA